jgi:mannose/fructose/N-acetylgalactosamine-specific phosphotransferase system component IIC
MLHQWSKTSHKKVVVDSLTNIAVGSLKIIIAIGSLKRKKKKKKQTNKKQKQKQNKTKRQ